MSQRQPWDNWNRQTETEAERDGWERVANDYRIRAERAEAELEVARKTIADLRAANECYRIRFGELATVEAV